MKPIYSLYGKINLPLEVVLAMIILRRKNGDNRRYSRFLNPYVFLKTDTQDDKEFPTKGVYFAAEGKVLIF
jgi:hypothetical protein